MMKKECKGLWIPIEIYENEELSVQDIFLLCEIHSLDNGEGCFAKNEHFCGRMKIKERAMQNHLNLLSKGGFIKIVLNRKNNTRVIFSNVNLKVYEIEQTRRKKLRELTQNNAGPDAKNCVSIYKEENTLENTLLEKKQTKKETHENQIVEPNKMVDTESKIPSESEKEKINANFEYVWKEYSEACKKQNRRPGNKSKSSKLFDYAIKNKWDSEVVESILFYAEDCILRNCYLKNLESFLSKSENYVEEWKNGSENHQALLELKNKPQKHQNNSSRFESKTERVERNVREQRESITSVLEGLPDELFAPEPDQKLIN